MIISTLKAQKIRNFSELSLQFHSRLNLFYGENGSGKTTLLEALYFLSYGKSFRTHQAKRLIQDNTEKFTLHSKLISVNDQTYSVGVEKDIKGEGALRLNNEGGNIAEITALLPIQVLNNDSFALLNDGPAIRRQFLDWGLFHVKQSFLLTWRSYQRALKQRNLAIKKRLPAKEIQIWDGLLIKSAIQLSEMRTEYVENFISVFMPILSDIFQFEELKIRFYQGWPRDIAYSALLASNFQKDLDLSYTYYGAHRADLKMTVNNKPIEDVLSRGQQKIFVWLMRMSQALILTESTNKTPIFLIDDISSELDETRLSAFCDLFQKISGQLFVTGIAKSHLKFFLENYDEHSVFHVKHNTISCE